MVKTPPKADPNLSVHPGSTVYVKIQGATLQGKLIGPVKKKEQSNSFGLRNDRGL
jgi:hypothetical protein